VAAFEQVEGLEDEVKATQAMLDALN